MYGSGRLLLSIKKEVSGTFPSTCPVTALPVSYRRRLTQCTALSTTAPGHPGLPAETCIYVQSQSLATRAKRSFYWSPPKINGSNSKLSLLRLHNLEKKENNYEHINATVSFSVFRCCRSMGCLFQIIAHERMHLLSINTKGGGTLKTKHMFRPVFSEVIVYIFLVILFSFVILTISNLLLVLRPLIPLTLPSPFNNLDVKLLIIITKTSK